MFKKLILIIILLLFPSMVYAEKSFIEAPIEFIGAVSSTYPDIDAQSFFSVGLDSEVALGTCPLVNNKVYFENPLEDKEIYTILMNWNLKEWPVRVYWDDSQKSPRGYCMVTIARGYKM